MSQRELQIRPADTPSEELAKILDRDGCVVLKDFASKTQVESIKSDLQPFIEATMRSNDDFGGFKTTRTGALMARSPRCRELAIDPRLLGLVETFLAPYANTFQLHVTQVIRVLPGEKVQLPHRDRWVWSQFQLPPDAKPEFNPVLDRLMTDIEPQLNTMLALTDFTKENGATRVAPGSTKLPVDEEPPEEACVHRLGLSRRRCQRERGRPNGAQHRLFARLASPGGQPVPLLSSRNRKRHGPEATVAARLHGGRPFAGLLHASPASRKRSERTGTGTPETREARPPRCGRSTRAR
jgi:hypothetical protein